MFAAHSERQCKDKNYLAKNVRRELLFKIL